MYVRHGKSLTKFAHLPPTKRSREAIQECSSTLDDYYIEQRMRSAISAIRKCIAEALETKPNGLAENLQRPEIPTSSKETIREV